MKIPVFLKLIVSLLTIVCSITPAAFAANAVWSGAVSDNWSDAANWSGATPPGNAVIFNDTDATGGGAYGTANNIVDANFTVQSLRYGNTNGYHNTSIPAGVTLSVESTNSPIMYVGTGADNGAAQTLYSSLQGTGSLLITNTSGIISIIQGSTSSGAKNATLDMESLNSFTAYVSQIRVAAENGGSSTPQYNRPGATLILAKTNFIYASGNPGLRVSWSSGNGGPGIVKLGATNAIFSNSGMNIGDRKSTSTTKLEFNVMFSYPTPAMG